MFGLRYLGVDTGSKVEEAQRGRGGRASDRGGMRDDKCVVIA